VSKRRHRAAPRNYSISDTAIGSVVVCAGSGRRLEGAGSRPGRRSGQSGILHAGAAGNPRLAEGENRLLSSRDSRGLALGFSPFRESAVFSRVRPMYSNPDVTRKQARSAVAGSSFFWGLSCSQVHALQRRADTRFGMFTITSWTSENGVGAVFEIQTCLVTVAHYLEEKR
jgi:hypothetical protein